jgi:hypothetical protein
LKFTYNQFIKNNLDSFMGKTWQSGFFYVY